MSSIPPDYPHLEHGQSADGLSVSQAAASLGLSVNAVRHKIRRGTLPAVKVNGEWRVQLLEGMPPRPAASPRTGDAAATPEDRPPDSPADMPPTYPVTAERQLEVIRDTLLRPLIEQNERQQERIADQAETIGRLTAERDDERRQREAAESRLSELERLKVESLVQAGNASETATGEASAVPWWQFWRRSGNNSRGSGQ